MIHVFSFKNYNYVYDVGSGSLHECDADLADYLKTRYEEGGDISRFPEDFIKKSEEEIAPLREAGTLFCEEVKAYPAKSRFVKALCLHICHDCNLRCKYCFADEGAYHSERAVMSLDTAKKAVDFLWQGGLPPPDG